MSELLAESKYYCVEELSDAAEKAVRSLREREREAQDTVVPICRVPLITSKKEEQVRACRSTLNFSQMSRKEEEETVSGHFFCLPTLIFLNILE